MDGGADWSGRLDGSDGIFVFCVAALEDSLAWNASCEALHQEFGMPRGSEFHGHEMRPDHLCALLEAGSRAQMQVGALIIDCRTEFPSPLLDYSASALELLRLFLPRSALQKLWYDEEIQGKKAQQKFETEVYRCQREIFPQSRLKVRARSSKISNLIQLADVVAYALTRDARRKLSHFGTQQLVRTLKADAKNVIIER